MKPRASLLLILFVALLLPIASTLHGNALALRAYVADVDPHVTLPDPRIARLASLGYSEMAADFVWVRTLVYYGDGLVHHTGMPDVERLIELANVLDPWFRMPYEWGAHAVTFRNEVATPDEYEASVRVLRRAVKQFPEDAELAWLLGFRLFYDVKGATPEEAQALKEEGADYIERAMHLPGAKPDYPIMAAAMRTAMGQTDRALRELREMILNTDDEKARAELLRRYEALQGEASKNLELEAVAFDKAWHASLPFAPRSLFVLIGPVPASGIDLKDMAQPTVFQSGSTVAP